jgi:hypothetical protein
MRKRRLVELLGPLGLGGANGRAGRADEGIEEKPSRGSVSQDASTLS